MDKKYLKLLPILFIIGLTSCQNNKKNEMENQQREATAKIIEIFDNGNVDELDAIIAQDAVDHQMDTTTTDKRGLEGVKEEFRYFHKVFPDMKTTIHSIAVSGDTVFCYSTSVGTSTEPFMGMPANQKVTINGVDIMRFDGDKNVEHWGFMDIADIMKMMKQSNQNKTK